MSEISFTLDVERKSVVVVDKEETLENVVFNPTGWIHKISPFFFQALSRKISGRPHSMEQSSVFAATSRQPQKLHSTDEEIIKENAFYLDYIGHLASKRFIVNDFAFLGQAVGGENQEYVFELLLLESIMEEHLDNCESVLGVRDRKTGVLLKVEKVPCDFQSKIFSYRGCVYMKDVDLRILRVVYEDEEIILIPKEDKLRNFYYLAVDTLSYPHTIILYDDDKFIWRVADIEDNRDIEDNARAGSRGEKVEYEILFSKYFEKHQLFLDGFVDKKGRLWIFSYNDELNIFSPDFETLYDGAVVDLTKDFREKSEIYLRLEFLDSQE